MGTARTDARHRLARLWLALPVLLLLSILPRFAVAGGVPQALTDYAAFLAKVEAAIGDDIYGQPIVEIRFEGNRRVENEAMMLELDSSVGELVSERKLANDLRRLGGLVYFEDVAV